MGCILSKEETTLTTVVTNKQEWDSLKRKLAFSKSKYDTKRRDKLWELIDKDRSGSLTFAEVERAAFKELELEKILTRKQMTPILVRAFNACKAWRMEEGWAGGTVVGSTIMGVTGVSRTTSPSRSAVGGRSTPQTHQVIVRGEKAEEPPVIKLMSETVAFRNPAQAEQDAEKLQAISRSRQPSNADGSSSSNPLTPPISSAPITGGGYNNAINSHIINTANNSRSTSRAVSPSVSGRATPQSSRLGAVNRSVSAAQKERATNLQREEFRLFLMYIADYMELYFAFETIDTSGDSKVSVDEFAAAVPLLKKWGLGVTAKEKSNKNQARGSVSAKSTTVDADAFSSQYGKGGSREDLPAVAAGGGEEEVVHLDLSDPAKAFALIDNSGNGQLTFKEFSDWAIREHMKIA